MKLPHTLKLWHVASFYIGLSALEIAAVAFIGQQFLHMLAHLSGACH